MSLPLRRALASSGRSKKNGRFNAVKKLEDYYWPGNIRQLNNVLKRALILCNENIVDTKHIRLEDEQDEDKAKMTLKELEKIILLDRLAQYDGNKTLAAKSLGVSLRWVQKKISEYNS